MSNYTPTTDEVRDTFKFGTCEGYCNRCGQEDFADFHTAEFDRWLDQHDAEVTAKAEIRILRLLVEHQVIRRDALGSLVFVNCDTMAVEYLPEVLAEGWKK